MQTSLEGTLQRPSVETLVERGLDRLRVEFPDQADRIGELGRSHLASLRAGATIEDFLPTLVYRFTRDDLRRGGAAAVPGSGGREVGGLERRIQAPLRAAIREVLLVVNAHASGVRPDVVAGVEAELAGWGVSCQTLLTESADEWVDALNGDTDSRVLLLGGDGTLHAAANAGGARPELALIPAGRANNVARSLGIPLASRTAARFAVEGRAKPIDVIEAVTPSGRYIAVEGLSVGFLSQARSHYHGRNSDHLASALAAGAQALATFHPFRVRVTRETSIEEFRLAQLFVANLPLYGFGLQVAPGADPTDRLLDIVAIEGRRRSDLLPMIARLRLGTELERAETHRWRAERARIHTDGALPVIADSLDLGTGPVDLRVLPGALRLVRP